MLGNGGQDGSKPVVMGLSDSKRDGGKEKGTVEGERGKGRARGVRAGGRGKKQGEGWVIFREKTTIKYLFFCSRFLHQQ